MTTDNKPHLITHDDNDNDSRAMTVNINPPLHLSAVICFPFSVLSFWRQRKVFGAGFPKLTSLGTGYKNVDRFRRSEGTPTFRRTFDLHICDSSFTVARKKNSSNLKKGLGGLNKDESPTGQWRWLSTNPCSGNE